MVILVFLALLLGILYGYNGLSFLDFFVQNDGYILDILLVAVGISIGIGMNKGLLAKIKEYNFKIFIVPIGVIIGTTLGGIICSFILKMDMNVTTAIVSGYGWYSLSGIIMTELTGSATLGSITFLSNLMREIMTYLLVPFLAKKLNYVTAIAPGGATSIDTTLPMISKYTNDETVIFSVMSGFVCSTLVPVFINLWYKLL